MTPLASLTGYFVAAFAVGLGVGVALGVVVRLMRAVLSASD